MNHLLCAFCADAPMARWSFDDDKARPICAGCDDGSCEGDDLELAGGGPPARPGGPRDQIVAAITRRPGMTFTEIRQRLGVPSSGRHNGPKRARTAAERKGDRFQAALRRAVILGQAERRGEYPEFTYWPAAAPPPAEQLRQGRTSDASP